MSFLKRVGWLNVKTIPNTGKMVIRPTMRTLYLDVDGASYETPSDTLYARAYKWVQNEYTIILPGLTEWCDRYRQAFDVATKTVSSDFDWKEWHRDGLLFTKEIFRGLPRHIPLRYAKPEGDDSGLVEDFDVTEEAIDDILDQLGDSQTEREPATTDTIVVGTKTEDGDLCIRFKVKGKYASFTFVLEYDNLDWLKSFLERLVTAENNTVVWESNKGANGMCFYPQKIGGIKDMGQLHIHLDGSSDPVFTAYINKRQFIRSFYRSVLSNLGSVEEGGVYKKIQSNMLDWYIDDEMYKRFAAIRKNPSLARWLNPSLMKMKDFLSEFYNSIYEDEI